MTPALIEWMQHLAGVMRWFFLGAFALCGVLLLADSAVGILAIRHARRRGEGHDG